MQEAELIIGCIKRSSDHQRKLFDLYAGRMMSVCQRYTNDAHVAQDILQTGFIKVFEKIHQFRGEGNFEGWMKRIFVHIAIRQLQSLKRNTAIDEEKLEDMHYEDPAIIAKMSAEEIHQLIKQLPDGYRTVFNLHVIEGYSHDEIGELLKIKSATSRSQLLKARKMLQNMISKCLNLLMI